MIERIKALCEAATPGPWIADEEHGSVWRLKWAGLITRTSEANDKRLPDAVFIAHARQLLPLMLSLYRIAVGEIGHDSAGECPDRLDDFVRRDESCPACRILIALDEYAEHLPEGKPPNQPVDEAVEPKDEEGKG